MDIVVGYFESHGRSDTILKSQGLEVIPRRQIEYRGAIFEEMDVEAILRREPRVCLVDELAHANVPGSGREKRWEDVLALLEHGIDVLTTVNIQHIESLNDQVWHLTGIRVRETVPDTASPCTPIRHRRVQASCMPSPGSASIPSRCGTNSAPKAK